MRFRAFRTWVIVWVVAGIAVRAQQAPIPQADALPGRPYAIRNTWVIGGSGNWDYLTLDPAARRLFVTRQAKVQVVDIDSGTVGGEVTGFSDAHAVVLDPNGQTGYVSDGRANKVFFFDRHSLQVTGEVALRDSPRALVFEPQTGMLFAFGSLPTTATGPHNAPRGEDRQGSDPCSVHGAGSPPPPAYHSLVSIIDPGKKARVADVELCGVFGGAETDGRGQVYFAIQNLNEVGRLNSSSILQLVHEHGKTADSHDASSFIAPDGTLVLDLRLSTSRGFGSYFRAYPLGSECQDARAVAVDGAHQRVFAGCANQKMKVIAADTGASVAALIIGPGVDAVAYDAGRGLIFTANGGGYGSLSIVRRSVTDSYAVIQNLPTMQQARTLAIDPSTGLVYLVTTLYGADLKNPPMNGIGTLKMKAVPDSFQVLVIGN